MMLEQFTKIMHCTRLLYTKFMRCLLKMSNAVSETSKSLKTYIVIYNFMCDCPYASCLSSFYNVNECLSVFKMKHSLCA